jgi:hypothetical protein
MKGGGVFKKRMEFSKMIVTSAFFIMCLWITSSFVLAAMGKDTNTDVAVAAIAYIGAAVVGYFAKDAFCKNSRNKYGIDKDGIPFNYCEKEEEENMEAEG